MINVCAGLWIEQELFATDRFAGMVDEIHAVALGNGRYTTGEHPCLGIFSWNGNLAGEAVEITSFVITAENDKTVLIGRQSNLLNIFSGRFACVKILDEACFVAGLFDKGEIGTYPLRFRIAIIMAEIVNVIRVSEDTRYSYNTDCDDRPHHAPKCGLVFWIESTTNPTQRLPYSPEDVGKPFLESNLLIHKDR